MEESKRYVFVYGTLKRGQRNHGLLDGQAFIQDAVTLPCYRLHDCGHYPALVEDIEEGRAVKGEVYLVDRETLAQLDLLEDVPHLYQLGPIQLRDCSLPVCAYFYQRDVSQLPDCGESWPGLTS